MAKIPKKVTPTLEKNYVDVDGFSPTISLKPKPKKTACGGVCENCLRTENCGLCDICHDIEKYGLKYSVDSCRLRRCLEEDTDNNSSKKKAKKEAQKSYQVYHCSLIYFRIGC